jgi:hypothetical protein
MIFERGGRNWRENVAAGTQGICLNCGNSVSFEIWGAAAGPYLGSWVLPKKAFIGKKAFFQVCPVCSWAQSEVTRPQLLALKTPR